MSRKLREIIIISVVLIGLGGGIGIGLAREGSDSSIIGPYTEILLPLEDLPALNENLVYHPLLDSGTFSLVTNENVAPENAGARLQVLYVLEDPRAVPLARYASNDGSGVVLPNTNLINQNLKTINVYVRVKAPLHKAAIDSILTSESTELNWPALYVVPHSFEMEGVSTFPCAPVEYADGTSPYQLPSEIDGGEAVREDGLYDPAAYAPPKPWYYSEDPLLEPGEVREGWVSCLAPDLPLEQLQVKYRHTFIPGPEIVFAEKDRPLGGPYPELSELEVIGITNADIPQTIGECAEMDYCLEESGVSLDQCKYAAQEAGLEQGLCVQGVLDLTDAEGEGIIHLNSTDPEAEISEARVFYTIEHEEPTHKSYLLWNYTVTSSFPVSLIRLEDVPLIFIEEGFTHAVGNISPNIIKGKGSVTFYDPMIDYAAAGDVKPVFVQSYNVEESKWELVPFYPEEPTDEYTFFSRVVVKPENLTREASEGYRLYEIGAQIDALFEHEGNNLFGTSNELFFTDYFVQSSDPLEGFVYTSIGQGVEPFNHTGYGPLHPGTALINIYPIYAGDQTQSTRHSFHPVNVISIFRPNLVAETNMCDVVDCLEVSNPESRLTYSREFPPRTVPVMCAGEWGNNFIIDGVDLVPEMYYIGEPWGLGINNSYIHVGDEDNILRVGPEGDLYVESKVLLYDGRVMGGASPWWIYGTTDEGIFGRIIGNIVDLKTGSYLYNHAHIIPYYKRVDKNDLSQGYFTPGGNSELLWNKGWMGDIVNKKILVFGIIDFYDDQGFEYLNDKSTGFLFHSEGPIWVTECPRQIISNLADQEIYAPANIAPGSAIEEDEHEMKELLPGMDYPLSLPVINGEDIHLGEYSDPVSYGNYRIAAKQIKIVPGKPDIPTVYVESEDNSYPAEEMPNFNNRMFFARVGAVVIPPDTSYVRVKISIDYLANDNDPLTKCGLETDSFQLVYPGYLPIPGIGDRRYPERWPCDNQDYSTWITFLFPSLDIELDKLQLSVRTDAQDPWFFFRLTEN